MTFYNKRVCSVLPAEVLSVWYCFSLEVGEARAVILLELNRPARSKVVPVVFFVAAAGASVQAIVVVVASTTLELAVLLELLLEVAAELLAFR